MNTIQAHFQQNIFAECVGKFENTRNKGFAGEDYDTYEEETLADCQQLCVEEHPMCHAVDFKNGICRLFGEYSGKKLIENVGNVHSVMKPCDR